MLRARSIAALAACAFSLLALVACRDWSAPAQQPGGGDIAAVRSATADAASTLDEDQAAELLEQLRALPYVGWDPAADATLDGVVLFDRARTAPGYNIYTDDRERVYLTDLTGRRVHEWRLPRGKKWCEYAELLDDGGVAVICVGRSLTVLDWDSTVRLDAEMLVHHDVQPQPDGTFLVPINERLRYRRRLVWFDSIVTLSPTGEVLDRWSTFERLRALRELHAPSPLDWMPRRTRKGQIDDDYYDYYHLNNIEALPDTPLGRRDPRFRAGHWLICLRNVDYIAVVDAAGEVVWSWGEGILDMPHMPTMLPNGNILIFDNGKERGYSRILEIDPPSGEIVWSYQADRPEDFLSAYRGSSQRLANGNTLICESERGHVFEVTATGDKVWEFWNPDMKGDARRRIYRYMRVAPARVEPYLQGPVP